MCIAIQRNLQDLEFAARITTRFLILKLNLERISMGNVTPCSLGTIISPSRALREDGRDPAFFSQIRSLSLARARKFGFFLTNDTTTCRFLASDILWDQGDLFCKFSCFMSAGCGVLNFRLRASVAMIPFGLKGRKTTISWDIPEHDGFFWPCRSVWGSSRSI